MNSVNRKWMCIWLMAVVSVVLGSCGESKPDLSNLEAQLLVSDEQVITGVLDNGLTYYIRGNKMPEQRAVLYLVNKIGSVQETEEQRGIAHYVEHMAFRGTQNFPEHALIDYLQRMGVKFGADLNAYTSYSETVYQLPIPSDDPELLNQGLQILRDWAQDVIITDEAVASERGVILAEMRQRQGLSQRIREQSLASLLNGARYAERSPIGTEFVVKNVTAEELRSFYKNWYRPDLQAIVAVGDFDVADMEAQIKARFSDMKNPDGAPALEEHAITLTGQENFQTIVDDEIVNTTIQVLNKYNVGKGQFNEQQLRNSILVNLFNSMMANRLNDFRRGADAPFLSASANLETLFPTLGSATMTVTVNPGAYEEGFKAVMTEVKRVRDFGFTEPELSRAKANFMERQEYQFGERDKVTSQSYVTVYTNAFLKGIPYPSADFYYDFYRTHVPHISLEEVQSYINRFYQETNRDVFILAPVDEQQEVPDRVLLEQWTEEVEATELVAHEEKEVKRKLMDELPTEGQVVSESYDENLGITTWKLSNGATVLLKPTTFRNDQVLLNAFSEGGSSLYSDEDYQSVIDAVGILSRGGIADIDAKTYSRMMTGKLARVTPYISENHEGLNASSSKKDLETMMQLVYLNFTQPRLDRDMVDDILKEARDRAARRHGRPANVFSDSIVAIKYGNHFRKSPGDASRVDRIDAERSLEIYLERFADASDFTFVIVGSFEPKAIKPLVQQYIASLPALNRNEGTKNIEYNYAQGPFVKEIRKGKADRATVRMEISGPYEDQENLTGYMTALREIVRYRMTDRLRGKENQVYSPSVGLSVSNRSKRYELEIGFVCAPHQVKELIKSATDELNSLARNGATAEELVKFKAEHARGSELQEKRNDYWLGQIVNKVQVGEDLSSILETAGLIQSVESGAFRTFASKYLKTGEIKSFVLLPE